jgi:DNA repair protein RecO (recombination protein O)
MSLARASEAIILRSRLYAESDKIVTFLTLDAGKLTGIAKGAKNSRRRFANCLDPFTYVRVHYRLRPGPGLVFMESCDLLRPARELAEPIRFAYGSYLLELVDLLTEEAHPIEGVFHLLHEAIRALIEGPATAAFLRAFEIQLLCDAGYEPQLLACNRCQSGFVPESAGHVDTTDGNITCSRCRPAVSTLVGAGAATLNALEEIKRLPLALARQRGFSRTVAAEAAQLMGCFLALHLPRPPRSLKLIAALT